MVSKKTSPERAVDNPVVHPTATVDPGCSIGQNTKIWHYSHVMEGSRIGRNCILGQNVFVGTNVKIGNNVKIQNNVSIFEGVRLEDDVFCGPGMVFTNVLIPRSHISRKHELQPTLVRRGATLGAGSIVLCDRVIGRFAFVAAGAVVTKDVPDYGLVMGNPARLRGWMCQCGVRLEFSKDRARCVSCGHEYKKMDKRVVEALSPASGEQVSSEG
ncbi:MAG: acyltransferase [Nitrospinota bacterium]